jgi:biopolymer transport protein TolR
MGIKKTGSRLGQGAPVSSEINVTPLIDVVLVLLIIFMVLTPITIQELMIKLPDDQEQAEDDDDVPKEQLLVAACEDGTIALNRQIMTLETLGETLIKKLKTKPRKRKVVFVDAHPDAGYDRVVALLDVAKESGAEKLGLARLKTAEDFTACAEPTPPVLDGETASEEGVSL